MGFNVRGWPFNSRNTKEDAIIQLLNNHRPDILINLESHLNDSITALSFHDDYEILLNNPSIGLDVGHSRGRGILFLGKKGLIRNSADKWYYDSTREFGFLHFNYFLIIIQVIFIL